MKRLVYCLDGTTNEYDSDYPTNVVMLHKSVADRDRNGVAQTAYYNAGVGTERGEKIAGMAVGFGLMRNVLQAYDHLCSHYEPGDEIYIFGFSRGAYTARSFAGLIYHCSIATAAGEDRLERARDFYESRLTRTDEGLEVLKTWRAENAPDLCVDQDDLAWRQACGRAGSAAPRLLRIRYLGVWDTVKTLGLIPSKYDWHDHSLSPAIEAGRHAVALDERRTKFAATLWDSSENGPTDAEGEPLIQQKWFPGDHGSVGGGGPERGLSDAAFQWVLEGARKQGLEIRREDGAQAFDIRPKLLAPLRNAPLPKGFKALANRVIGWFGQADRAGPATLDAVSHSARVRYHAPAPYLPEQDRYRPGSMKRVMAALDVENPPYDETDYRALYEDANEQAMAEDEAKLVTVDGRRYWVHIVRKGDTLYGVAKQYLNDGERYPEIAQANEATIADPDQIYIGQRILVPFEMSSASA